MRNHSEWKVRLGFTLLVFAALACNLPFQGDTDRAIEETELEEESSQENGLGADAEGEQESELEDAHNQTDARQVWHGVSQTCCHDEAS